MSELDALRNEIAELRSRVQELESALDGQRALEHLKVERLDVQDSNGTVRLALANGSRSPDTVIAGEVLVPGRERPGIVFFNDEGSECGGLVIVGRQDETGVTSGGLLAFDRYNQDQVVAVMYEEDNGSYAAGIRLVDRPELSLVDVVREAHSINQMPEGTEKDAVSEEFYRQAPFGQMRLFLGRDRDASAKLEMADAAGRPRLRFVVPAEGEPVIEVLDTDGAVQREI